MAAITNSSDLNLKVIWLVKLYEILIGGILCCEEILHIQGKRNPSKTVGAERRHQRAERLKPQ